jgi:hypothetical protein
MKITTKRRRHWQVTGTLLASLTCSSAAWAQETAVDSVPGASRPPGVGLSPEAPPTPPAAGGRAPSFGAPSDPDAFALRIGGRISAWTRVGLGRSPEDRPGSPLALHTPPLTVGKNPLYGGTAASLNFQYGNQLLMAYASYEVALTAPEWEGYHHAELGPRIRAAYVALTPPPLGRTRLRFQVGAFSLSYGAPGPWGWGLFGPVLAVHGYGGVGGLEYELAPGTLASFEAGTSAVPEVSEGFVRGTYTGWPENGLSSIVHHAHLGLSVKNKYFTKLHFAHADGRNMRRYLDDDEKTKGVVELGPDGYMQVAALEFRWMEDPYGHFGVTPVVWNMKNARYLHDGLYWGLDWTAGGREMTDKFLGPKPLSQGTGQLAAISAEYDFSVRRLLAHPKPFDGNGHDLRAALAFEPFWTLDSDDKAYKGAGGYFVGATFEHVILSWLSTTWRMFGESRRSVVADSVGARKASTWRAFSASAGLALHSDWQSQDRIELMYSRYFYSSFTDNNPTRPLDRDVFTLGASVVF